ncbi:la-related protein 6B-like [Nicotiana tabacum]|uniref:La-related protein 6B-like n=1 Tax=Nicotiana tabacum TaxID=4097 RepID=A0A1S3X3C9_TOBAC|nr:PREDICTED: la-related protein 6B-like [Nicotiana tabacum]
MALEDDTLFLDSLNSPSATSSSASLDLDHPFEYSSTTPSSSSPSQPLSLPRNSSLTKLNARAAAFIPRSSSSPSLSSAMLAKSSSSPSLASLSHSVSRADSHQPGNGIGPGPVIPQNGQTVVHVIATPAATFHQITTHVPGVQNYIYASQLPVQYPYGGIGRGFVDHGGMPTVVVIGADSDLNTAGLSEEACQKIVNQVEFYFSDINLATTDHLIRIMFKDPEGYVPMSVVASFKKIKALTSSHAQVAKILRTSTKLVVSEDGKKVRRQFPLSEMDLEELQSRIVVAENLPEDHCHQNLMKIFSAVGSVKMIRTCQPQSSNGGASSASRTGKSDSTLYSTKLHAFVEYESIELAEKAVMELNDENNWRNGLKLRILNRCTGKCGQNRGKKVGHESELNLKEEDAFGSEASEKHNEDLWHHFDTHLSDLAEEHGSDGQRKGLNRSWIKGQGQGQGRGRLQFHQNNRGGHLGGAPTSTMRRAHSVGSALSNFNRVSLAGHPSMLSEQSTPAKQASVPRMPDGTRGFSMGRGKPVAIKTV